MVNRKKRLQRGIESLEKQIKSHEEKLRKAEEEDNIELAEYYKKEINAEENLKKIEAREKFIFVPDKKNIKSEFKVLDVSDLI